MGERTLLVSIRPRFAEAIIEGRKTVEVRRQAIRAKPGSAIVLYATAPRKAIVATASISAALRCNALEAWRAHKDVLGLTRSELEDYLRGGPGTFILLEDVREVPDPVSLDVLRRDQGFRPPRSFRYVSPQDPGVLRALAR